MPLNTKVIEQIIKQRRLTKGEVADKIGMTREGFSRSIGNNKLQAEKVELLADILGVKPLILFGEDLDVNQKIEFKECVQCAFKDALLAAQDHELEALRKIIKLLERNKGDVEPE